MSSRKVSEVFTLRGEVIKLGSVLGQGGEGAVYELPAHPKHVAKVYHRSLAQERADKIRAMVKLKTEALESLTAWPLGLICSHEQKPIGLIVPKVVGRKDIHHLYSPKSRRSDFQRVDWRFLIRAAANTARAFAAVHSSGCVIGDVNHGGVLVAQDATVRLIDCDSFQVSHQGRKFLCEVGVETFTPPELQGKSFAGVLRSSNHDNFGLSVLAFLLLFMGRHPFAGRYAGQGDMPISKAIEEVRFPYGASAASVAMSRPPGTPSLAIVGPRVSQLFERAFSRQAVTSGRPSAHDWVTALAELESQLKQCNSNPSHWHHPSGACPWCPMEGATGIPLFSVIVAPNATISFDIIGFQRQVDAVQSPGPAPTIASVQIQASPDAVRLAGSEKNVNLLAGAAAAAFVFATFATGMPWLLVLAIVSYFGVRSMLSKADEVAKYQAAHAEAASTWHKAYENWLLKAGPGSFDDQKTRLAELRRQWDGLPARRASKLDVLKQNQRKAQLDRFLDNFEIADAKIDGIGPGRKQTLESYGVETALDVTQNKLYSVPGFGPKMTRQLLDWRRSIERRFVFDPKKGIDPRDISMIDQETVVESRRLQDALAKGLAELRQVHSQILATRQHMRPQMNQLREKFDQTHADKQAASS
ncbi:helix-hairpin-helix domain-containing protein [Aminobacter niigataensis]|uniref:helix-hairpin-helix domain-containing protein n=1 Tax=Aminobacter niigataensis TaxID=83265 RepID=UPI0024C5BD91|nr:hypothetical protein [Aminobacter niigataensis]CAI2931867.1 Protein kinase domain-containing protein [Aminobacter niigataensis]